MRALILSLSTTAILLALAIVSGCQLVTAKRHHAESPYLEVVHVTNTLDWVVDHSPYALYERRTGIQCETFIIYARHGQERVAISDRTFPVGDPKARGYAVQPETNSLPK